MHRSQISPFAIARAKAARSPIIARPDPRKTAHIVVDLQNAFLSTRSPYAVPRSEDIVPNVNRISSAIREAGGINAFVRFAYDDREPNAWTSMHRQTRSELLEDLKKTFATGSETHALHDKLNVQSDDFIVDKTRFSAFTPGTCNLKNILDDHGIETVIITGTVTNCCCEATARDAMQLGYSVLFVEDACAAYDDATHNATLSSLCAFGYADVCTTEKVLALLH